MRKDTNTTLYILIALLFVALGVQGYFVYNLQQDNRVKATTTAVIDTPMPPTVLSIDPFVQMQKIQERMMKDFGSFNSHFANDPFFQDAFSKTSFSAISDIIERDKEYIVEIKLPGVDEQKIEITTHGNTMNISAQSQSSSNKQNENYIHKESFGQSFKRSFNMPPDADLDTIKRDYKDGVLKITILKKSN